MKITPFLKKYILPNFPYAIFFWFFTKVGEAWRLAKGTDAGARLLAMMNTLGEAMSSPWPGLHPLDWLVGAVGAAIVYAVVYFRKKNAKKYRHGVEYGSARWGTAEDIKSYMDEKPENNIILTESESLTMNPRPKNPKYARNKNILIIGGSGSGKTRFWLKPNLMQCQSKDYPVSFVVTDPKGTVLIECGRMLQRFGYKIKVLNTIDFKKSMRYNPFAYIRSEKDILKVVTSLIANTKGEGKSGDDFWEKAEVLLYTALIAYIHYEAPDEERNINTMLELINAMEVREEDETFKNAVDLMFDALEERDPEHFAVRQYKKYKLAAGKTAKSILISCAARLGICEIAEVRDLLSDDELELDTIGDEKTALFVIISDTDTSFSFIAALMYSQIFNLLCDKADNEYGGRLPVHVRCLLDEFANIGQIPKFEKLIATIRSREISACVILQAQSQLKAIYKDNMETIVGNMDTTLFLGGKDASTLKSIHQEWLGKETIDQYNTSVTKGTQESHGQNFQKLGKDLMTVDELQVLDGSKCILQVRGCRPFLSNKYDITKHRNYKYLADADKKNTFDIERYLSTRTRPKPGDVFEAFEYIEEPEQVSA